MKAATYDAWSALQHPAGIAVRRFGQSVRLELRDRGAEAFLIRPHLALLGPTWRSLVAAGLVQMRRHLRR